MRMLSPNYYASCLVQPHTQQRCEGLMALDGGGGSPGLIIGTDWLPQRPQTQAGRGRTLYEATLGSCGSG